MAASTFAQVNPEKLRTVPTDLEDETSRFLVATHLTDTNCMHRSFDPSVHCVDSNENGRAGIQVTQGGDWFEYQIVATKSGDYAAVIGIGCDAPATLANVSIYKTEFETWMDNGERTSIFTDEWHVETPFTFPLGAMEAGIVYTLRISWFDSGSNIFSVKVIETIGSTDATLSDIKLNGESLADFDPATSSYNYAMPPNTWITSLEGIVNDANATVEIPELGDPVVGKSSFVIKVTSESGVTKDYTINVSTPVLVDEGVSLTMNEFYFSNGVNASATKVNNMNNNDYIEYYVYSEYDENVQLTFSYANGYGDSFSYLNVSTLTLDDSTWTVNDIYTKHMPITYDDAGVSTWNSAYAKEMSFVFPMKAEQPTLIRIYSITNKGNAADIFSMTFKLLLESIDATLSDLQVDGSTVPGFDPNKTSYAVALPAGATSVSLAATANDAGASVEEGIGSLAVTGFKTSDTITVTSESGFSIDYKLHFYTPLELAFTEDTLSVMMGDWVYMNGGVNATNERISSINNEEYVEYYLYSASDKDVHLILNVACGNEDTAYAKINVSTYAPGSEWTLDEANSMDIPGQGVGTWGVEFASDVKYNLSLKAGEATVLRVYGITNGAGAGDIYSAKLVQGKTSTGTAIETAQASTVKVWGAQGYLNVRSSEAFVGANVQVYDVSGRLVVNEVAKSSTEVYKLSKDGLYIVKVVDTNNKVTISRCLVK